MFGGIAIAFLAVTTSFHERLENLHCLFIVSHCSSDSSDLRMRHSRKEFALRPNCPLLDVARREVTASCEVECLRGGAIQSHRPQYESVRHGCLAAVTRATAVRSILRESAVSSIAADVRRP